MQNPQLIIRAATPDDASCLCLLAKLVFLDTYATNGIRPHIARELLNRYSEQEFRRAIGDERSRIEVAEITGHMMVGFAQVTLCARHESAPAGVQAELLGLCVQEPFTGIRIGTRLLERAEHLSRTSGATVSWLTPWAHNHKTLAFYGRRGYVDYGPTYVTFEGELHENRVLAKVLCAPSAA